MDQFIIFFVALLRGRGFSKESPTFWGADTCIYLIWRKRNMQWSLHKKMKFSTRDFFSKCEQIRSFLWIWSHLLKQSLMENFIFCAVDIKRFQKSVWGKKVSRQVYQIQKWIKGVPNQLEIIGVISKLTRIHWPDRRIVRKQLDILPTYKDVEN